MIQGFVVLGFENARECAQAFGQRRVSRQPVALVRAFANARVRHDLQFFCPCRAEPLGVLGATLPKKMFLHLFGAPWERGVALEPMKRLVVQAAAAEGEVRRGFHAKLAFKDRIAERVAQRRKKIRREWRII